ncbi:hypothetical protein C8Q74DRAFT_1229818 [Fomes fomentarius]|nr:hypothetical protein C8Q74DRAFT_1229818 [Fomes fomentarius]
MFAKRIVLPIVSLALAGASVLADSTYIKYPNENSTWYWGYTHNVTWDQNHWLEGAMNPTIKLFKGQNDTHNVLAKDFNLTTGRIEVIVPEVEEGPDYVLRIYYQPSNVTSASPVSTASQANAAASSAVDTTSTNTGMDSSSSALGSAPPSNATIPSQPVTASATTTTEASTLTSEKTEQATTTAAGSCNCSGARATPSAASSAPARREVAELSSYIIGATFTILEHPASATADGAQADRSVPSSADASTTGSPATSHGAASTVTSSVSAISSASH